VSVVSANRQATVLNSFMKGASHDPAFTFRTTPLCVLRNSGRGFAAPALRRPIGGPAVVQVEAMIFKIVAAMMLAIVAMFFFSVDLDNAFAAVLLPGMAALGIVLLGSS